MILRAQILVREWGEPDRYVILGPFVPEAGLEDDEPAALAALEDNLRRQGDDVLHVWRSPDAKPADELTRPDVHDYAEQADAVFPPQTD